MSLRVGSFCSGFPSPPLTDKSTPCSSLLLHIAYHSKRFQTRSASNIQFLLYDEDDDDSIINNFPLDSSKFWILSMNLFVFDFVGGS
jgi:hypothetical protein